MQIMLKRSHKAPVGGSSPPAATNSYRDLEVVNLAFPKRIEPVEMRDLLF